MWGGVEQTHWVRLRCHGPGRRSRAVKARGSCATSKTLPAHLARGETDVNPRQLELCSTGGEFLKIRKNRHQRHQRYIAAYGHERPRRRRKPFVEGRAGPWEAPGVRRCYVAFSAAGKGLKPKVYFKGRKRLGRGQKPFWSAKWRVWTTHLPPPVGVCWWSSSPPDPVHFSQQTARVYVVRNESASEINIRSVLAFSAPWSVARGGGAVCNAF